METHEPEEPMTPHHPWSFEDVDAPRFAVSRAGLLELCAEAKP
jgi:hypothetical protein